MNNTATTQEKLTDWLTANGFGFKTDPDFAGVIILTGEWLSGMDQDAFDDEATIETVGQDVYHVRDCSGQYRLEVYDGSGANGIISDWEEGVDA